MKRCCSVAFLALAALSVAQWPDVQRLGQGGESFVSTDGKGNVYATSHQPCKLYVSHDFGKSFAKSHDLPESFCDVTSTLGPDGTLYVGSQHVWRTRNEGQSWEVASPPAE